MKRVICILGIMAVSLAVFGSLVAAEDSPWVLTTIIGTGEAGFSGDNGPAIQARLNSPSGIAVDASGNIYIVDSENYRVRKVENGLITTIAGKGRSRNPIWEDGIATNKDLENPTAVAIWQDKVYVCDAGTNRIRFFGADGIIRTIAGKLVYKETPGGLIPIGSFYGDGGPAIQAGLNNPVDVVVDANGNIYIADTWNHRIRKVKNGIITTIAGSGPVGVDSTGKSLGSFAGDGGPATQARLNRPSGVAVDASGNVYIADTDNRRVRKVDINGIITTFAGSGRAWEFFELGGYEGEGGLATQAILSPEEVAVDAKNNVFILHRGGIRCVWPDGIITDVLGANMGDDLLSSADGIPAVFAKRAASAIATSSDGVMYVAEGSKHRVRRMKIGGPPLKLSTSSLAFGNIKVGESVQKTLILTNTGSDTLYVHVEAREGSYYSQELKTPTSNFLLAPGQNQNVLVTFAPTSEGMKSAILSINRLVDINVKGSVTTTGFWLRFVPLSGTAVGISTTPPPVVTQPPPVVTQPPPTQPPPSSGTFAVDFAVTNTAGQLNLDQGGFTVRFTLQLTNQPPLRSFKWDFGDGATSKEPHPEHTYAAGGAYTVTVTVTAESGQVIIKTKEKFITVTQSVTQPPPVTIPPPRLEPKIYVSSDSLDFRSDGITRIGIAVMNIGSAPLEITKIVIGGPDSLDFSVSPVNLMIEVEKPGPQNNVGKVSIVFAPQTAGEKRARLFLYHNAPNSPAVVKLRGTSVVIPEIKLTPDFNGDGWVNFDDLWPFVDAFGQKTKSSTVKFDLDGNGWISLNDFFIFAESFGKEIKK